MHNKKNKSKKRNFMQLEERILLDASLLGSIIQPMTDPAHFDSSPDPLPPPVAEHFAPATDGTGVRLLVVASNVDHSEALAAAAASSTEVVVYDASSASLNDITAAIQAKLGGRLADSIAFANEGQAERMILTNNNVVDANSLSDASMQKFWQDVGSFVKDGGRVDLLACNLVQSSSVVADGIDVLLDVGKQISVAASSDFTGSKAGADWNLERGIVNAATYFDTSLLSGWNDSLATFLVTNTNPFGAGSFDQAITDANNIIGQDTIDFSALGPGIHTISSVGFAPSIVDDGVIMDGNLQIVLDGSSLSPGQTLLRLDAGTSIIRGMIFNNQSSGVGILVGSDGNIIQGNYIGTDALGTTDFTNGNGGIQIISSNNIIGGSTAAERNVISGYNSTNILINGGTNNRVTGNYIGLNASGTATIGNSPNGIAVLGIGGNIIGGNAPGEGNVISGNQTGILFQTVQNTSVQGNYIGTDASGTVDLGNTGSGIFIGGLSSNITIGGTNPGDRNIISGNNQNGILISNGTGILIQGNYIGTDVTGNVDLGNSAHGISLQSAGNFVNSNNVISGNNQHGIVSSASNTISGNFIGTNAAGTANLGNSLNGIVLSGGSSVVGGSNVADRNIISGNDSDGVLVTSGSHTIQGNYIGTDVTGTLDLGNSLNGVNLSTASNIVNGNVISGNNANGVLSSVSNTFTGNFIGTNAAGTADLGNTLSGIELTGGSSVVGGSAATDRNIISGNDNYGVLVRAGSQQIKGNYIGTDVTGTVGLGNSIDGIRIIFASGNVVGGATAGERNIISGNNTSGINVVSGSANNIQGNYIGTDVTGSVDLGNNLNGIQNSAQNTLIRQNVISGNNNLGISNLSSATGTVVTGNFVGTNAAGTSSLGNATGITSSSSTGITIGGSLPGDRNIISGNNFGITVFAGTNIIQGNYIGTDVTGSVDVGNNFAGIQNSAHNTLIHQNVISGNNQSGINTTASITGAVITGNFIGTDATGTADLGNTNSGVGFSSGTSGIIGGSTVADRNIISGNDSVGIFLFGAGPGRIVQGNYIGTDVTGTLDLGNSLEGIRISNTSNDTIGGATAGERNIISGNDGHGITLLGTANNNLIQGNYIGTDVNGTADLGNSLNGILAQSSSNTINRNVISGNNQNGVLSSVSNTFTGNFIGTNAAGTADLGNTLNGIELTGGNSVVGGSNVADRNIISGNDNNGVLISAGSHQIKGNYIGTDVTGVLDLGNAESGVSVNSGGNIIGGGVSERNIISGNEFLGISVMAGTGNTIQGNYIGTDVSGSLDVGNGLHGVNLQTTGNIVNGNVISGNNFDGIFNTTTNTITGNYIGTNAAGTADLGNSLHGIELIGGSSIIGGSTAADRNIISGNDTNGVHVTGGLNTIQGNYVGTDVTGSVDLGNSRIGINILTANNIASGNVVSGNNQDGIFSGDSNTFTGNFIGTNAAGTADLGNTFNGIQLVGATSVLGGSAAADRNIISGNDRNGIVTVGAHQIKGNYIGTDITGTVDLGNSLNGIQINGPLSGTIVGGAAPGERNIISGNDNNGVLVSGGSHQIIGNYIGTDVTGNIDLGNSFHGISLATANNIIKGNVVSGNNQNGVLSSLSNTLTGNYIGTNAAGTADLGNTLNGIELSGGSSIVGGSTAADRNIISGNDNNGVLISGGSHQIKGNYVGTNAAGTADIGNEVFGIRIDSSNNFVGGSAAGERNIISGNNAYGMLVTADSQEIKGNYIGTDVTGMAAIANGNIGIAIQSSNNIIGGPAAGERNIISGNGEHGIEITLGAGNAIQGNYIGLNALGTGILSNVGVGIRVLSSDNSIGGGAAGEGNVISGNDIGIFVLPTNTSIKGNYIGTNAAGTADLGNTNDGILLFNSTNGIVGGSTPGERNIISGNNRAGVNIYLGSGNKILGNYIGTDVTGTVDLGNTQEGIQITNSFNNVIGGTTAGERNVILGNDGKGINITTGTNNALLGNKIFANGGLGIDLGNNGVTLNDTLDPDAGANNLQNFPVLLSATNLSGNINIQGTFNSEASKTYRLEFYSNDNTPDPSGYGEGKNFLGFVNVTTNASGNATFTFVTPGSLAPGTSVTSTATETSGVNFLSTSEFSQNISVPIPPTTPKMWGVDRADRQLFSIGDYNNALGTFTNYGTLVENGQNFTGSIESFALDGNTGYFVINDFKQTGHSLNNKTVLAKINVSTAVVNGPNEITVIGKVSIPGGHSISGLAIDPFSGRLFATQQRGSTSGNGADDLIVINKSTGAVQETVGTMDGDAGRISVAEDLKFDAAGHLFVTDAYDDHTYEVSSGNGAVLSVVDNNQKGGLAVSDVMFEAMAFDHIANKMIGVEDLHDILAVMTPGNGANTALASLTSLGLTDVEGMDMGFVYQQSGLGEIITFDQDVATFNETKAVFILNNVDLTDGGSNGHAGDRLTVQFVGGTARTGDVLKLLSNNDCGNTVKIVGSNIYVKNVLVGTFSGGVGTALNIDFNTNASQSAVESVMESIAYDNTTSNAINGDRLISFQFFNSAQDVVSNLAIQLVEVEDRGRGC